MKNWFIKVITIFIMIVMLFLIIGKGVLIYEDNSTIVENDVMEYLGNYHVVASGQYEFSGEKYNEYDFILFYIFNNDTYGYYFDLMELHNNMSMSVLNMFIDDWGNKVTFTSDGLYEYDVYIWGINK